MNENDAFYNALIDVAAWDKENINLLLQTVRM